jgi:hypothetical protein
VLEALIVGVIYCAIVLVVCWLLVVLVGLLPIPAPMAGVIPMIIWVIGAIICLVVLLNVVRGTMPSLP